MTETWLDQSEPEQCLALYLSDNLEPRTSTHNVAGLTEALGYASETTVKMWVDGRAKVPLRQISPIADFLGVDIAEVLPYWLSQNVPEDDQLYRAATRMLTAWEFLLVSVARDIYGVDE